MNWPPGVTAIFSWNPVLLEGPDDRFEVDKRAAMNLDAGDCALDFLSANAIALLPIRIDPRQAFEREVAQGTRETVLQLEQRPTLGTVVHSLLLELTFWGLPDRRRAFMVQRTRRVKAAQEKAVTKR